jgi:hypothetical protein
MAQIEDPQTLGHLQQPHRLMMQILIRTGLRLADTYRLEIDCLVNDQQNAPVPALLQPQDVPRSDPSNR